jgi:hypothetical protein
MYCDEDKKYDFIDFLKFQIVLNIVLMLCISYGGTTFLLVFKMLFFFFQDKIINIEKVFMWHFT